MIKIGKSSTNKVLIVKDDLVVDSLSVKEAKNIRNKLEFVINNIADVSSKNKK